MYTGSLLLIPDVLEAVFVVLKDSSSLNTLNKNILYSADNAVSLSLESVYDFSRRKVHFVLLAAL